jgi:hypothetical protein
MEIEDMDGRLVVVAEGKVLDRLRSVRRGAYGAFILSHDEDGPSLWVHTNGDKAYLHFFPDRDGDHPGFQSTSSSPEQSLCHFVQTDGGEADSFDISGDNVVAVDLAYAAAVEFFRDGSSMPASITWREA